MSETLARPVWWLMAGVAGFGLRGAIAVGLVLGGRRLWRRRRRTDLPADLVDFVTLLSIAVGAGSNLPTGLELACREVGGSVRTEVEDLLRRSRLRGLAPALLEADGALGPLAGHLARAQVSGASVANALETYVATMRADERARHAERARTLPVRLIIPVSLLLLPGFVALVLGPVILDQVGGFAGLDGR